MHPAIAAAIGTLPRWASVEFSVRAGGLGREFLELAGITPAAYRRIAPARRNHLPLQAAAAAGSTR
jgi:hypothetical protein